MTGQSARVLLVDDDETTRRDVATFLSSRTFVVTEAQDGVDALRELKAGLRPDIILLDLVMPVMDGAQFHAALRANPDWEHIPVILLTGAPEARPPGVDALLSKPVDFPRLLTVMRDFVGAERPKATVLVVEDEEDIRESTRELLEHVGYVVETAEDGQAAIDKLQRGLLPDLIVTDLMMPRVGGIELVRHLRLHPRLTRIPVIVVSAATSTLAEGLDVEGILAKPIDTDRLLGFVKSASRPRARSRTTGAAASRNHRALPVPSSQSEGSADAEARGRVRFFAAVAHELRGPLQSILSAQQLMHLSKTLEGRDREYLKTMNRGTHRLVRLVEDLLDFLNADATGFFRVTRVRCDLRECCTSAVDDLRSTHPGREISFAVDGDVHGLFDEVRIAQVLSNLVHNALKYGDAQSPVSVMLAGVEDSVLIQVSNAGPAIPEAALVTLFDPFKRAVAQHDARPGLGLGLAIVRQIAFAHEGAVDVESNETATIFSVVLPRAASA